VNVARPKKSLGQHFLVDENILGVIGRLADLSPQDVVLEIGPGVGMLTQFLAARVSRVVAVELDTSLEPYLRDSGANVELHFGDARAGATRLRTDRLPSGLAHRLSPAAECRLGARRVSARRVAG
jgi:16S rRNA A1518/A1519 N6-dimethyltransferase RsmA/KsgA/DIM1 with predicted DNA glycosylase/AP lyase activity